MLSMVNRDAAAAPPRLSSSRMVTPDWLPSKLMPFGVSPFWLPLLPMWFPWLAADPPPCCLEPRMLSMVNRDAAAAPPRLSSSRMVTPDWLPSSEEGV